MSDVKSVSGGKGKEDIAVRLLFMLMSVAVFLKKNVFHLGICFLFQDVSY